MRNEDPANGCSDGIERHGTAKACLILVTVYSARPHTWRRGGVRERHTWTESGRRVVPQAVPEGYGGRGRTGGRVAEDWI